MLTLETRLAKEGNSLIIPADVNNPAGFVAQSLAIYDRVGHPYHHILPSLFSSPFETLRVFLLTPQVSKNRGPGDSKLAGSKAPPASATATSAFLEDDGTFFALLFW